MMAAGAIALPNERRRAHNASAYKLPCSIDTERPQLGNAALALVRALALASLFPAGGLSPAAAQEAAPPESGSLRLSFTEGLGYEAETGEPGALVVRELLAASYARLSGSADVSSAIGVAPGNYSALIDSAGLHFAYRLLGTGPTGIFLDSHLRYRELFEDAWELRAGGTVRGEYGAPVDEQGLFGDWAVGFEEIRIAITGLPIALWGGNPLLRIGAGWRFSPRWALDAAIEFFSDEDAAYFPRTLFEYGSSLELPALTLRCRLVVKYSDFPTPTGYFDGYALRVTATVPIQGGW